MLPQDVLYFSVLSKRIKQLRQEKGIDQKAFAFDCNISRTQLHHIEKGETDVRLGTFLKITNELDVPLSEFFRDLEKNNF